MQKFIILYLILINLTGFLFMGIDKYKAIHNKWRIREKTLFLTALLFGSIGILGGMYFFRHKTKHLSFRIGIPAILIAQMLLLALLVSWNHGKMSRPSQTVEKELARIRELDPETIQAYVSYENLINSRFTSNTLREEAVSAVNLFFKNFRYKISDEQIDGNDARVSVTITNIDTKSLARDLCRELLRQSVAIYPGSSSHTESYFGLLSEMLEQNSYDLVSTSATFHLQKEEDGWNICSDETLEDELVSGFISCMNDPHLLSVSAVVSIHLDELKKLTADQWGEYLSIEDVFSTYNSNYSQEIDSEYLSLLAETFDYQILKSTENGTSAEAVVRIQSINMTQVLEQYRLSLLDYALSSDSLRDDSTTFSDKTSLMLLEALKENHSSSSTDVKLTLHNNGTFWEINFDFEFTNALMGNITEAIQVFRSSQEEVQNIETRY